VRGLPLLQREVLILAEYEELSLEEIARAVESEVGTVKSRLHRARENLRRMLAPLKPQHEQSECKPDAKRKRDSAQPQGRAQPVRNGPEQSEVKSWNH